MTETTTTTSITTHNDSHTATDGTASQRTARQTAALREYAAARAAGDTAAADEAMLDLLESLAGLTRIIAREHRARVGGRVEIADVHSETQLAVIAAAHTYLDLHDPSDPATVPFARYAAGAVRNLLIDHIPGEAGAGVGIRVPDSWRRIAVLAHTTRSDLEEALGRPATLSEQQAALRTRVLAHHRPRVSVHRPHLSADEVEHLAQQRAIIDGTWGAIDNLADVIAATAHAVRLDEPTAAGGTLSEVVGNPDTPWAAASGHDPADGTFYDDPALLVGRDMTRDALATVISTFRATLAHREQRILDNLMSDKPASSTELGLEFGISRQRVCQITNRLLDRLRSHDVLDQFAPTA